MLSRSERARDGESWVSRLKMETRCHSRCQPRAQADTFQSRSLWHSPPAKLMDTICQVTSKAVTPCIETSYFSLIEDHLSILCSQLRVWEVDNNVVIIAGIVCPESGQAPRCELCQEFRWIPIFANDSEPQDQARGPLVSRGAGSINCQDVTARARHRGNRNNGDIRSQTHSSKSFLVSIQVQFLTMHDIGWW